MRSAPTIGSWRPVTSTSGRSSRTMRLVASCGSTKRYLSPRMVLTFGKCGNSGPNRLLTSATRCSGSHTTQQSVVSPTAASSSMRRPSTVRAEPVVEEDVGRRLGLGHRHARVLLVDALGVGAQHVEPDPGGAHAQTLDALVVGLAGRVVGLRDVGGAGLLEQVDATDVVDVGLGRDDVVRRPRADGVEDPLVVRRLVAHAGVDDHPPAVGEEQVGGGVAARAVDEAVDDGVGGVVVDRGEQLLAGPGVDEVVDLFLDVHWTSIRTGKRSR